MRIRAVSSTVEDFALTRPYAIAGQAPLTSVPNVLVRIETESGAVGLGAGSPGEHVTGETIEACRAALSAENLEWLTGRDVRSLPALCREAVERFPLTPAARAAVDIALHDLLAQELGVPLVEMLGRSHDALPTSITIGIKPVAETLAEAEEYLGRGFRVLKLKIGDALEEDLERIAKLREGAGRTAVLRVDANVGYTLPETARFFERAAPYGVEFVEQPVTRED
ncbi:MAG: enolase C-terminal domain-like protein, partial [Thermoanaerobaculia bacterium]